MRVVMCMKAGYVICLVAGALILLLSAYGLSVALAAPTL
jgi:hypothetical protein